MFSLSEINQSKAALFSAKNSLFRSSEKQRWTALIRSWLSLIHRWLSHFSTVPIGADIFIFSESSLKNVKTLKQRLSELIMSRTSTRDYLNQSAPFNWQLTKLVETSILREIYSLSKNMKVVKKLSIFCQQKKSISLNGCFDSGKTDFDELTWTNRIEI